jgi:RimJ/RimL family protein N-acetyltransferase
MRAEDDGAFPEHVVTQRLVLRRPRPDEGRECGLRFALAEATRNRPLPDAAKRKFGDFMVGHWRLYGFGFFVVETREKRVAVGSCGLKYCDAFPGHWPGDFKEVELGYALLPEFRGAGYATEAVRAVLSIAFEALDVPCVRARCNLDNDASARVLARCGMREVRADRFRRFERWRVEPTEP